MNFFTKVTRQAFFLFILLASSFLSSSQVVDTGRQTIKGQMNFTETATYFLAHPSPLVVMDLENEEEDDRPMPPAATSPGLIHYRPTGSGGGSYAPLSLLPTSVAPTDTFEAVFDNNTSIPPDTHGAVDSNYCMTTINTSVQIQTRAGALISNVTLNQFWLSVLPGGGSFDPRVHYDPYTHRWIVVAVAGAKTASSCILIGISKTSNPTGGWWLYNITAYAPGDYWLDFPDVGFNKKWITVTGNLFENTTSAYGGAKVFVFNKANLLSGVGATYTAFTQASSACIAPALTYDTTLENLFAIESWNGNAGQMRLWKISGAVGSESLTSVGYPSTTALWQSTSYAAAGPTSGADFATQSGTANKIQTNDDRVTQAVYMNNRIWCAHTIFLPYSSTVNPTRSSVQWWQVDTLAVPVQIGHIDDATSTNFYAFPTLAVNKFNDALVGFSQFSATTHPNACYALRLGTDPTDSLRPYQIYRHGQNTYYKTFSGTKNRFGDYSAAALDPLNSTDFWTLQETVSATANRWDTWWAYVRPCTPPGATITAGGPTTICTGGNVTLNANTGTGLTYQWQLGGSDISGATNASYVATTGGSYDVIVSSGSCSSTSSSTTVTVTSRPPATITPAGPTTFCVGSNVLLNANTGVGLSYQWQLNGTSISGATSSGYTASLGGNYTVIVSQGICDSTSLPVTVTLDSVYAAPISGATSMCTGQTKTLTDATPGGVWSSSVPSVATISSTGVVSGLTPGITAISYTVTNACGTATASTFMNVSSPTAVAAITGTSAICQGQTSTLSNATPSGVWSSSNPATGTISGSGVVTGLSAGTTIISYSVTNASGCTSGSAVTFTVNAFPATPTISPSGATTFCTGGYVVLSTTSIAGVTYQWQVGGVDISGATANSYTASTSGNYTVRNTSTSSCAATSAPITVSVSPALIVVPSVGISASPGTTFCSAATPISFTPLPTNGGVTPSYQWYLNGTFVSAGATYTLPSPVNGDVIRCRLTSSNTCAFPDTASSSVTITLSGAATPTVNIIALPNDTVCTGDAVTYSTSTTYSGTAPTWLWKENGINVATGPTYTTVPHDGDILTCTMTSNYYCLATPIAVSPAFIMHVLAPVANTVSITASATSVSLGSSVTFIATAPYAGTYQWFINGTPVAGATSSVFVTNTLTNGQIVNCAVSSNQLCALPYTVISGGITMQVGPTGMHTPERLNTFSLMPNPNNGSFVIKGDVTTTDITNIAVTDVLGKTVYKTTAQAKNGAINEQITLSSAIANGMYFVKITSGDDHVVLRVVVSR